jgi:3-dehydroquinate dehydratase
MKELLVTQEKEENYENQNFLYSALVGLFFPEVLWRDDALKKALSKNVKKKIQQQKHILTGEDMVEFRNDVIEEFNEILEEEKKTGKIVPSPTLMLFGAKAHLDGKPGKHFKNGEELEISWITFMKKVIDEDSIRNFDILTSEKKQEILMLLHDKLDEESDE